MARTWALGCPPCLPRPVNKKLDLKQSSRGLPGILKWNVGIPGKRLKLLCHKADPPLFTQAWVTIRLAGITSTNQLAQPKVLVHSDPQLKDNLRDSPANLSLWLPTSASIPVTPTLCVPDHCSRSREQWGPRQHPPSLEEPP